MFYNGANCDIYIGKGAGKKLLNDMRNARESVKIVSPYLSPFLISELISFRERNLRVELITTDNIEDFYGSYERNIHKLIVQNRETDNDAVRTRGKWKDIARKLTYVGFGLLAALIGASYFLRDIRVAVFGLVPLVIIFIIIRLY